MFFLAQFECTAYSHPLYWLNDFIDSQIDCLRFQKILNRIQIINIEGGLLWFLRIPLAMLFLPLVFWKKLLEKRYCINKIPGQYCAINETQSIINVLFFPTYPFVSKLSRPRDQGKSYSSKPRFTFIIIYTYVCIKIW